MMNIQYWIYIFTVFTPMLASDQYRIEETWDSYQLQVDEDVEKDDNDDGLNHQMILNGKEVDQGLVKSIYLGVDKDSNCMCREYSDMQYTTCYDPDKCVEFPRKVKFNYHALRISNTAIKVLRYGDLAFKNQHLKVFKMDDNESLERIEPGAFINMTNIRNMTFHQNAKLKHLHKNAFQGLDNLFMLSIIRSGFVRFYDITQALSYRIVPNLYGLRLALMGIDNVTRKDFEILSGSKLFCLTIVHCEVKYFEPEVIDIFKNLEILRISENFTNETNLMELLIHMIATNSTIKNLSLTGTGLRHIPSNYFQIIAKTRVTYLTMSTYSIDANKIARMENLEYLAIRNSVSLNISDNSFVLFPNLKILILNHNKYTGNATSIILPKVAELDFSDNTLNTRYDLRFDENTFVHMPYLTHLNLSQNNIRTVSKKSFVGLTNLTALDLCNSKIFEFENDCFAGLINLEYLDLCRNIFSSRMMRPEIYNGLTNLQILLLEQCEIENIKPENNIFVKMPNLRLLVLSGNHLEYLPSFVFESLPKLEYLDVSGNPLKTWEFKIFPPNYSLRTIKIQNTLIRTFTKAMIKDFASLEVLDIRKSQFSCTCELFGLVPKIITRRLRKLIAVNKPLCVFPDIYLNSTLIDYMDILNNTDHCYIPFLDKSTILLLIPITLIAFCLMVCAVLIYIYRWHIRYWVFLIKLAISGSKTLLNPRIKTKKSYRYDAFVSYSNEDRDFVIKLVDMLENYEPYLKLCVYERDFQIGTVIGDTVLESVGDSRRTLLVISDSYIKSQWCRWEVQVAENHRLFFEDEYGQCVNDSLVMIKLGNVSTANISPMLKYLLKTRIYLQWDEDSAKQNPFWKKLRRSLSPPNQLVSVH